MLGLAESQSLSLAECISVCVCVCLYSMHLCVFVSQIRVRGAEKSSEAKPVNLLNGKLSNGSETLLML